MYFTRSKYLGLKTDYAEELSSFGVPLLGQKWERMADVQKGSQKAIPTADGSKRQKPDTAPENEIDEEEQMDSQLDPEEETSATFIIMIIINMNIITIIFTIPVIVIIVLTITIIIIIITLPIGSLCLKR